MDEVRGRRQKSAKVPTPTDRRWFTFAHCEYLCTAHPSLMGMHARVGFRLLLGTPIDLVENKGIVKPGTSFFFFDSH